jgi:hypothetical protein
LDWEGVQAATGYRVFRAQKKDLSDAQDISGVTTELWYTDSTATVGMGGCHEGTGPIEYYYYLVAENACGESPRSAVVVGFVADPKTVAGMNPASLGNLGVIIVALAAMHAMRRTRTKRGPSAPL